ncbi:MAG TPA: flagellar protein FlgN [Candidatus Brocadiaceae bacterium]|nr:flagellar protein FlgN [Candidatus Brocadiaceae bacterium]
MNKLLHALIETFERLTVVYDGMLDTAKTKQQYLISGNIEGLETLLYQEKNQTEIAMLLENKRQNILERYCLECDVKENKITIHSLINWMDTLHGKKLNMLIDRLKQSLKQLQDLNETNATLTRYSLDVTDDIMKIFCSSSFQNSTYQQSGKVQGNELSMVLIDTEI